MAVFHRFSRTFRAPLGATGVSNRQVRSNEIGGDVEGGPWHHGSRTRHPERARGETLKEPGTIGAGSHAIAFLAGTAAETRRNRKKSTAPLGSRQAFQRNRKATARGQT